MIRKSLIALLVTFGSVGCSLVDGPSESDGQGVVSLRFSSSEPAQFDTDGGKDKKMSLAQALGVADYVNVKVYRPGTGTAPEKVKGTAITPPGSSVSVDLVVLAENDKRVAVELFEAGKLIFFGVDEDVDVVKGQDTFVSIVATSFEVSGMTLDASLGAVGENVAFDLSWSPVTGAWGYVVELSGSSDFTTVAWDTVLTDTVLSFSGDELTKGDYWFRVAAGNQYTSSEFSNPLYVDVYGPPLVSNVTPGEAIRGQELTITGDDLDFPGTQIKMYGQNCTVTGWSRTTLTVLVPANAYTDVVDVTNVVGTNRSATAVSVQTIAYIMGLSASDPTTAQDHKTRIDGYGDVILNSTTAIIPYDVIHLFNLGVFDVIVIGADTNDPSFGWAGGVKSRQDAVSGSGAMILGVGEGGCAYFDAIGLSIGLSNTATSVQQELYATDQGDPIFNTPNKISFSGNGRVDVYQSAQLQYSAQFANGTNPFATRQPLLLLFPLIEEETAMGPSTITNLMWGFEGSPRNLSTDGEELLENVVVYLFEKNSGVALPN